MSISRIENSIGAKLRAERKRLGLSQQALAELCGVTARSQRNYESGERLPDAAYLAALAAAGVDVGHVLHGQHPQAATVAAPADLEQAQAQAGAWYSTHIQHCARSGEWKSGALAGCLKAHGLPWQASAWPSGTAQDDARNAGFQAAYAWARHDLDSQGGAA